MGLTLDRRFPMKLLIAVDNSDCSNAAIIEVLRLGWPKDTKVVLLTAVRSDVFLPSDLLVSAAAEIERMIEKDADQAAEHLRAVVPGLTAAGLAVDTRVRRGDARLAIVDTAIEEKVDLVVVGSHGRSGLEKLLMGSVASHVVTHAPCSVLVVKRRAV